MTGESADDGTELMTGESADVGTERMTGGRADDGVETMKGSSADLCSGRLTVTAGDGGLLPMFRLRPAVTTDHQVVPVVADIDIDAVLKFIA